MHLILGDITRSLNVLSGTSLLILTFSAKCVSVSDYKLDLVQYTKALIKHSATIGAVYSPKAKLNNDYT